MKVEQVDADFWRVTEGHKRWTAKSVRNFGLRYWLITNGRGLVVDPGGPTGRRVIAAIRRSTPSS
ncbi:hypothetical protein BZL29_7822 [Mycobacterium kansasii]|uniref:MBL fold metallo-hydrolase n=1 Tax=Mycobacterium kansasii TaxID=1768 RepID=A0A1V3WEC5_MYCKA|nr:hypothetical protein BZL29_7822 [Mycobacterium kansasii]